MRTRNGARDEERAARAVAEAAAQEDVRERWVTGVMWLGALALALLATAVVMSGCDRTSTPSTTAQSVSPGAAVVPASTIGPTEPARNAAPALTVKKVDAVHTVAPDIAVSVPDTLVMPGQAIEVTVEGTPDVTEMALWDGLSEKLPMVIDSTGLWRVDYRVPLRPRSERLALSVTAKNEGGHWCRSWLFLHVQTPRPDLAAEPGAPEPDSTK